MTTGSSLGLTKLKKTTLSKPDSAKHWPARAFVRRYFSGADERSFAFSINRIMNLSTCVTRRVWAQQQDGYLGVASGRLIVDKYGDYSVIIRVLDATWDDDLNSVEVDIVPVRDITVFNRHQLANAINVHF